MSYPFTSTTPTKYDSSHATDLPVSFVDEFTGLVVHAAQQEGSMLRRTVREKQMRAQFAFIETMGATSMTEKTTRYDTVPLTEQSHGRRRLETAKYEVADLIEEDDELETLIDPTSEYVHAFGMAAGRKIDEIILASLYGTVKTGHDGSGTEIEWATGTTGVNIIGVNTGSGVYNKLRYADMYLRGNHQHGKRYAVISEYEAFDLFGDKILVSRDFVDGRPVVTAQLPPVLGFELICVGGLLPETEEYRRCFAYVDTAVRLGILRDAKVTIKNPPLYGDSLLVRLRLSMGGVRVDEKRVVEFQTPLTVDGLSDLNPDA